MGGLDDSSLVEVALVIDIEFAECLLQAEDLTLLELGILPVCNVMLATVEASGGAGKRVARATYFCSLIMFMMAMYRRTNQQGKGGCGRKDILGGKLTAWLSLDAVAQFVLLLFCQ